MGKCLCQLLLACLFTNKTMKKSDRQVRIGMKLMMNTWSNISCTVSTWLTEMCQISILCPVHIYHDRHSTHSDLLIWETMYLLGYTTYMYKFSIILMSHVGRSLFFGRASLGWLAVLILDRSLIIPKLVYCVPKGSGSFYVGHLWGWPFSYSLVTVVMYVRYWGTTPSIICVTVETPLKSNWPSLFVVHRSTPEYWSTCVGLPIVPLYTSVLYYL